MANIPYSVTDRAISVFLKGTMKVVDQTNPNFKALRAAVLKTVHDTTEIAELANIDTFFARLTHGRVQVGEDTVRWDGKPVHSSLPKRILALLDGGYDILPLVKFLDKLMLNPTVSARDELFDWLESGNNPITPDGNFLAFKKVRMDYRDIYRGVFDNSVGNTVDMDRSQVDPNRYNECSVGLHFCSHGYLGHYGGDPGYSRVMVVEIDPADVVAIPVDYQRQKGRTWRYKVVHEIEQKQAPTFFEGKPIVAVGEHVQPVDRPVPVDIGGDEGVFAIGDSARCIYAFPGDALTEGGVYTVVYVNQEGDEITVTDDDGDQWAFPASQFDVVIPTDEELDEEGEEQSDTVEDSPEGETSVTTVETVTTKVEKMFSIGSKSYKGSELVELVKKHGQRGTSRALGVARSTLQEWLKQIA